MVKKRSQAEELARWFVGEVLKRTWTEADFGGTHMAHASKLLKMYSIADITGCICSLVNSPPWPDFKLQYMIIVLKGEPPFIEQYLAVPDPPPVYEIENYDNWVLTWGTEAIKRGQWDGLYTPVDEPRRLSFDFIALILGQEYADKSRKATQH